MEYLKNYFEEPVGKSPEWGNLTTVCEIDEAGTVIRQIDIFDDGPSSKYDESHLEDENGGLSQVSIDAQVRKENKFETITAQQFNEEWDRVAYSDSY